MNPNVLWAAERDVMYAKLELAYAEKQVRNNPLNADLQLNS